MARTVLEVVVAGDSKSLERAMSRSSKSVDKFGKDADKSTRRATVGIKGIGTAAKTAGGLLAGSAVVAGLKSLATAASESEKSSVRLKAQLKASGISYKQYGAQIDSVIQKQSKLAALDDEDLQDAFTNIVRTTGSVEKSLRLVGLASDFARAKHMDVAKAGEIVAKVAGGNTGVLSRYGLAIKKGASATEALGVLQKKFGGQAEAYGKSSAGAFDRFSVSSENLKEKLGAKLLPSLAKIADAFARFIDQIDSGTGAGGKFAEIVGAISKAVGGAIQWIGKLARGFRDGNTAATVLVGTAASLLAGLIAFKTVTTVIAVMNGLKAAIIGVNIVMRANPFVAVATVVAAFGVALVVAYKKSEKFRDVVDGVFGAIKLAVGSSISFVLRRIDDLLGAFSSTFSFASRLPFIGDKFKGIADKVDGAREKIRGLADNIDALNHKPIHPRVVLTDIQRAIDKAGSLKDALKNSDITLTPTPRGDGPGRTPGRPSGSLLGASSALSPFASIGASNGLHVSSGKRAAGGRTVSGGVSYHGSGEAIDLAGPPAGMLRTFRALKSRFGSRLAELIYTPGGQGIKNGRPFTYTGKVAATHKDHVHVALDLGKPGVGDGPGRFSVAQLKGLALGRGLSDRNASVAAAVAMAESGGNPRAQNRNTDGSIDRGLWQINSTHGGLSTFDVAGNAKAMASISHKGASWKPWTTFNSGAYKRFLVAAQKAKPAKQGVVKGFQVTTEGKRPGQINTGGGAFFTSQVASGGDFTDTTKITDPTDTSAAGAGGDAGGGGIDEATQALIDAQNASAEAARALALQVEAMRNEQRDYANRANALATTELGTLKRSLADIVNGQLGGRVGLGYQSPGFAGGGVRY